MVCFGWFEVRKSTDVDIPHVYKIDASSMVSDFSEDALVTRLLNYGDTFLVATDVRSGEVLGYIIGTHDKKYTKNYPGYIYISRFAVKNKYRRQGIGTSLLLVLEHGSMMSGLFKGIVLDVRYSNTASTSFFNRNGYSVSTKLSKRGGYKNGKNEPDRYKLVLFKKFPCARC